MKRILLGLGVLIILSTWLGNRARNEVWTRASLSAENVIFTSSYRLNGTVDDDLVVVAETIELTSDSYVTGDVALLGAKVLVDGRVDGDLTVVGDNVALAAGGQVAGDAALAGKQVLVDGRVDGDLTVVGDKLALSPEARIAGEVFACLADPSQVTQLGRAVRRCSESGALATFDALRALGDASFEPLVESGGARGLGLAALAFTGLLSLGLTGLAALAVTIFPRHISHIEEAIRAAPGHLVGVGFAAFLLAVGLAVAAGLVMALVPIASLVLAPVALLGGLFFVGMVLAGWITLALVFGDLLLQVVSRSGHPPLVTTVVGSLALLGLWHALALVPFGPVVALLAMALLGSVGLGATVRTRLGTRPLRRRYFVQG